MCPEFEVCQPEYNSGGFTTVQSSCIKLQIGKGYGKRLRVCQNNCGSNEAHKRGMEERAIQVLCNTMGVGVSNVLGKNYEGVQFNVISVSRWWVAIDFPGKNHYIIRVAPKNCFKLNGLATRKEKMED